MNRKLKRGEAVALGFVWVAIAFGAWSLYSSTRSSSGNTHPTQPTQQQRTYSDAEVYAQAEAIVEEYLKAPSTAKFPPMSQVKIEHVTDAAFKVESYVDSENSFGAMLRSNYAVLFQYFGDKVQVEVVTLDGELMYKRAKE